MGEHGLVDGSDVWEGVDKWIEVMYERAWTSG